MGKATNPKARRSKVTNEAGQHGEFVSVGLAQRRVPVIETMYRRSQLSDRHYTALKFYRDQALMCESSPTRSCLDDSVRGGGDWRPSAALTSAMLECARIERDLGSLTAIARAVAVDDRSLTEWCIAKHGGRERYDGKGRFVAMVPLREKQVMASALLELRFAAGRIIPC